SIDSLEPASELKRSELPPLFPIVSMLPHATSLVAFESLLDSKRSNFKVELPQFIVRIPIVVLSVRNYY
ncbi:MAG: hypothetical protein O7B30_00600, partial [Thaumarchaeota archaeon]|nr:hypothetical protein [Nitrososphaerota archaeon]